jgi:IS1 family transposase
VSSRLEFYRTSHSEKGRFVNAEGHWHPVKKNKRTFWCFEHFELVIERVLGFVRAKRSYNAPRYVCLQEMPLFRCHGYRSYSTFKDKLKYVIREELLVRGVQ